MRTVIRVLGKELRTNKKNKTEYYISHVQIDDGVFAEYYGDDVKIGDSVEVFLDKRWDKIKCRHSIDKHE